MFFKKFLVALLVSLSLFSAATPKKAEAGVIIGALAGNVGIGAAIGAGAGLVAMSAVCGSYEESLGATIKCAFVNGPLFGGGDQLGGIFSLVIFYPILLLDAPAGSSSDVIAAVLHQSLPKIDDQEVIQDLAELVKEKGKELVKDETAPSTKPITVSLSCDEVKEKLKSAALTNAQIEEACSILK